MRAKSSTQMERFFTRFCQLRSRQHRQAVHVWTWFFSNFAVEFDWNSKILKTFRIRVFEKNLNFFKIAKGGKSAVECVPNGMIFSKCLFRANYEAFLAKNQKLSNVAKIKKWDEERVFFREKNVLIFLEAFLTKSGWPKIFPPSCAVFTHAWLPRKP